LKNYEWLLTKIDKTEDVVETEPIHIAKIEPLPEWMARYNLSYENGKVIQEYFEKYKFSKDYEDHARMIIAKYVSIFGLDGAYLIDFLCMDQMEKWK
jgi:hypothetical protein